MHSNRRLRRIVSAAFLFLTLDLVFAAPLLAQPTSGSIGRRVVHAPTGRYLVNVRVTVEGTSAETFTDELGAYRLAGVPGPISIYAFRTGRTPNTTTVTVAADGTGQHLITSLTTSSQPDDSGAPGFVKWPAFVVETSQSMDRTTIPNNEQRFAAGFKNIIPTWISANTEPQT